MTRQRPPDKRHDGRTFGMAEVSSALSIGELRSLITSARLSYADCVERSDLEARASQAQSIALPRILRDASAGRAAPHGR